MQSKLIFYFLLRLTFALRIHWPSLLGLILIVGSLGVAVCSIPALSRVNASLLAKQEGSRFAGQSKNAIPALPRQMFSARLATFSTLSLVSAEMQALAQQNHLQIATASYQPANDPVLPGVVRITISARLRGAYSPTKKMLSDLLATYPSLALQSVDIRREHSLDAVLEVETRWILFCQKS
jgi:hypothetical protein